MKKLTLFAVLASLACAAAAQDVPTLLKAADKYRMSSDNMQVDTQISVFNTDGSPDKERRYTVFAQAKHQSLVLMQSPAEQHAFERQRAQQLAGQRAHRAQRADLAGALDDRHRHRVGDDEDHDHADAEAARRREHR